MSNDHQQNPAVIKLNDEFKGKLFTFCAESLSREFIPSPELHLYSVKNKIQIRFKNDAELKKFNLLFPKNSYEKVKKYPTIALTHQQFSDFCDLIGYSPKPIEKNPSEDPDQDQFESLNKLLGAAVKFYKNGDITESKYRAVLNVIECLKYFKINKEYIAYAFDNRRTDPRVYKYSFPKDAALDILRDTNGMSFHMMGYNSAQHVTDNFCRDLVESFEGASVFFSAPENEDFMRGFINEIQDHDKGCIEHRTKNALEYFAARKSTPFFTLEEILAKFDQYLIDSNCPDPEDPDNTKHIVAGLVKFIRQNKRACSKIVDNENIGIKTILSKYIYVKHLETLSIEKLDEYVKIIKEGLTKPAKQRYLIKTVAANNFHPDFSLGAVQLKGEKEPPKRFGSRKLFAYDGDGPYNREKKKAGSNKNDTKKKLYSRIQSTTLVTVADNQSLSKTPPPAKREGEYAVGVVVPLDDSHTILTKRLYTKNARTVDRPNEFEDPNSAQVNFDELKKKNLIFSDLDKFENAIDSKQHNEAMARILFTTYNECKVFVGTDTLEARILAQDYARVLRIRLKKFAEQNNIDWDDSYTVPICFYLPPARIFTPYTQKQQKADRRLAKDIVQKHLKNNDPDQKIIAEELLLALDVSKDFKIIKANIFELLLIGKYHIAESLLEKLTPDQIKQISDSLNKKLSADKIKKYLYTASKKGYLEILRCLAGTQNNGINLVNENGYTLLNLAAKNGHLRLVQHLIKWGADIHIANKNGVSPLIEAAANNHVEIAQLLVEQGAKIDHVIKYGATALIYAAKRGNFKIIKYLIENKADINHRNRFGDTALSYAAGHHHFEIVKYLVENGADVNIRHYNNKYSPLAMVVDAGDLEMVKYLIQKGADITIRSHENRSLLFRAAARGCLEIVKYLVEEQGADVNEAPDNIGYSPLLVATMSGHENVINYLVKARAKIQFLNYFQAKDMQMRRMFFQADKVVGLMNNTTASSIEKIKSGFKNYSKFSLFTWKHHKDIANKIVDELDSLQGSKKSSDISTQEILSVINKYDQIQGLDKYGTFAGLIQYAKTELDNSEKQKVKLGK